MNPSGFRIVPVLARVRPGFALRLSLGEVDNASEVPLAFLMTPQNHKRERREWNGLTLPSTPYRLAPATIWGTTADILRNLYERLYRE